ncbi:MAG: hypothetical protein JW850_03575 [Thermoflexales bacterium]|nr:hypothetical protein [Thermoflexales bacterium]
MADRRKPGFYVRPHSPCIALEDNWPQQYCAEALFGPPQDVTRLREFIVEHFDDGELHTICTDLGIEYDDLPAQGRANKARELVVYCERRGRLAELAKLLQQFAPS